MGGSDGSFRQGWRRKHADWLKRREGLALRRFAERRWNTGVGGPITRGEVQVAIRRQKPRKATGPDKISSEALKLPMGPLEDELARLFTSWCDGTGDMAGVTDAAVVLLFTKGNARDMSNYRPISLLNTMYIVYCTILQRRLAQGVEAAQFGTQYGFKAGRSTSSAVYCIRRIQDRFERGGRRVHVLLLDWEKAFDRVHMDRVAEVLRRLGCPEELVVAISRVFRPARFKARVESGWHWQNRRIRQGCPLSPFLFVTVMTALFWDVRMAAHWGRSGEVAGAEL